VLLPQSPFSSAGYSAILAVKGEHMSSGSAGGQGPYDPFGLPTQPGPPGQYSQPLSEQFRQQFGPPGSYPPGSIMPRRTNSLAIAALCCGLGQLVAGPLAGVPAIILGAISLRQIRGTGEDGHGMAVTGLVLGIVGVVLGVLLIALAIGLAVDVTSHTAS
jgi:Domain of unknown function (DUF4190)